MSVLARIADKGPLVAAATLAAIPLAYLPMPEDPATAGRMLEVPKELLVKAGAAALAAIVALRVWRRDPLARPPLLVTALVIAFAAWYGLAALLSPNLVSGFAAAQQIGVLVVFLGAALVIPGVPRAGLAGIAIAGVITATMVSIQELGGVLPGWRHVEGMVSPAATFLHRNRAAYLIALAVPLVLAWRSRWTLLPLAPLALGLVATRSRGAWLCAIAGVVVLLVLDGRGARLRAIAARLALLGAAAALVAVAWTARPSAPPAQARAYAVESLETRVLRDYGSVRARWKLWGAALDVIAGAPLLGAGPGQFAEAAQAHHDGPLPSRQADNELLATASEAGIPAAALLAGLAMLACLTVIAGARRVPERFPAALAAVTIAIVVASIPEAMIRQGAYSAICGLVLGAAFAGLGDPCSRRR